MKDDLIYTAIQPEDSLDDFVESFWMLYNPTDAEKPVTILPDGRIDLFFSESVKEPFHVTFLGVETKPEQVVIPPKMKIFAVSFKLPAVEYVFKNSIHDIAGLAIDMPQDFWDFSTDDLNDFSHFCEKASQKIKTLLPDTIDDRTINLFRHIYQSKGAMRISELSEKVFWSSRQINRYFNKQYGFSLKTYCTILRFRASFQHIKAGRLYPQENFADQSHFIKEVKKLSGVLPKDLSRNQNDRFIQFSTLPQK